MTGHGSAGLGSHWGDAGAPLPVCLRTWKGRRKRNKGFPPQNFRSNQRVIKDFFCQKRRRIKCIEIHGGKAPPKTSSWPKQMHWKYIRIIKQKMVYRSNQNIQAWPQGATKARTSIHRCTSHLQQSLFLHAVIVAVAHARGIARLGGPASAILAS